MSTSAPGPQSSRQQHQEQQHQEQDRRDQDRYEQRRREQWRREQRKIARVHHPDLGGEPEQYIWLMQELDRRYGYGTTAGDRPVKNRNGADVSGAEPVIVVKGTAGWSGSLSQLRRGVARRAHRGGRALRARLPRSVPGSRRYIDL